MSRQSKPWPSSVNCGMRRARSMPRASWTRCMAHQGEVLHQRQVPLCLPTRLRCRRQQLHLLRPWQCQLVLRGTAFLRDN
ncbi:unnamed protein product, partial [Symbiodinium necroappetens]